MTFLRQLTLLLGLGLTLVQPSMAAEPPPIAAFFQRAQARQPKLSPSGRYLAIQALHKSNRMVLAVIDLETMSPPKVVGAFKDADVAWHAWVSEDRLVFELSDTPEGNMARLQAEGLWAVNRDGTEWRQLINAQQAVFSESTQINDRRLGINWSLHSVPPVNNDEVLVLRQRWSDEHEHMSVKLAWLNTRTGLTRNLNSGLPDDVVRWVTNWQGEPRVVEALRDGKLLVYQPTASGGWQLSYEDDPEARQHPMAEWFGPGGLAFGRGDHNGRAALFPIDAQSLKAEASPMVSFEGYDYQGQVVFDAEAKKLLGLHYETDAPGTIWFDPTMKAMQADIDAKLTGTVNRIECRRCLNAQHLIVTAYSDLRPPVFLLYKTADKSLQALSGLRTDMPASAMGQRDYHRVTMRDGLEIPVLVTQAGGKLKGPRPTVLLVHGGPYVRGTHWEWESQAQFLASRGYVVLEPEFRGSKGFGYQHFQAGWKQWGLAMQDDLADTLAWAVKKDMVDPQRVCIAGASYGGYAALMGAVKQGDLFRCAIDWVGVTDIGLLSTINWSDVSDEWKQYGMKRLVADPDMDADQIKATSPLRRAAEIKIPLLMAYGGLDRRVPIKHGSEMKSALRADQPLEWVVYPDEGHGWFELKTQQDFWGRVERFLAKHIGRAATEAQK